MYIVSMIYSHTTHMNSIGLPPSVSRGYFAIMTEELALLQLALCLGHESYSWLCHSQANHRQYYHGLNSVGCIARHAAVWRVYNMSTLWRDEAKCLAVCGYVRKKSTTSVDIRRGSRWETIAVLAAIGVE